MKRSFSAGVGQAGRRAAVVVCLWMAGLSSGDADPAASPLAVAAQARAAGEIHALLADKAARNPAQRKMDSHLIHAAREALTGKAVAGLPEYRSRARVSADGRIEVDLRGKITDELLAAIKAQGGTIISAHPEYGLARVSLPVANVEAIAARDDVRFIRRAVQPRYHTGSVDSEGDTTHQAIQARQSFAANGTGISVGVLSDSIDNKHGSLAAAYASSDLDKATTFTISGQAGEGDGEGLAIIEILHDIAPGAKIYFAQGGPDEAQMAANIRSLASAGCKVIIDDITFDDESPFQDGVIAQAVDEVCGKGVLYFSSAANSGNLEQKTPSVWEGDFKDGGDAAVLDNPGARYHLFTSPAGGTVKMNKIIDNGGDGFINLFWSDPFGQSANDYDLFMVDAAGNVEDSSTDLQDGSQDPYESIESATPGDYVVVVKSAGAARFLHVEVGELQFAVGTNGDVRGHNAASAPANMFCIAAAPAHTAFDDGQPIGPFPNPFNANSKTETFTSDGPRRMFYSPTGLAFTPGNVSATGGKLFARPDFTAADGVVTTLPADSGLNPFFGTSCAAPHAGAIAALLLSHKPGITPADATAALRAGVVKISETGATAGAGILLAPSVLQAASTGDPVITSSLDPPSRQGVPFGYNITATNSPTSFATQGLPAGLGLSKTTGRISGTPTSPGTYSVRLNATNANGTGAATMTLVIKQAVPVITSSLSVTAQVGVAFSYQITATGNPTSFGESGIPAGLTINQTTGKISGKPTKAGTYNVIIAASNSGGKGTAKLSLVVK